MSKWVAVSDAGIISWSEGSWEASPRQVRETVALEMSTTRTVSAVPVGPFFNPQDEPEQALLCVALSVLGGSCRLTDEAPIDTVVPPVPEGAVS